MISRNPHVMLLLIWTVLVAFWPALAVFIWVNRTEITMNFEDAVRAHQHAIEWLAWQYAAHHTAVNIALAVVIATWVVMQPIRKKSIQPEDDDGQG